MVRDAGWKLVTEVPYNVPVPASRVNYSDGLPRHVGN